MDSDARKGTPLQRAISSRLHFAIANDLKELLHGPPAAEIPVIRSTCSSPSLDHSNPVNAPAPERKICQVQFKHSIRYYKLSALLDSTPVGEFVIVRSLVDKSHEDLGIVTQILSPDEFDQLRAVEGKFEDPDENKLGRVLRAASAEEKKFLPVKFQREYPLFRICQTFIMRHSMPMTIFGLEYQFDGNVLFIYYESEERVDYRPLVKFLIKMYCPATRILLKKIGHCRPFQGLQFAKEALISGKSPEGTAGADSPFTTQS